ncbi:MAG: autotransporter domain-containing protein [Desulfocapsaceae bacterium]|nr:autotransporter domain-containing protein [Desulfocapsaceae bacterium]
MQNVIHFRVMACLLFLCPAAPASADIIDNPIGPPVDNIYGTSGSDIISNEGTVTNSIYGSPLDGSDSGFNSITNSGTAGFIEGSYNTVNGSSAGSNSITNSGTVNGWLDGSWNLGDYSNGGSNNITNSSTGQVYEIYGSANEGIGSNGGSNNITNSGLAENVFGSWNGGDSSNGGFNNITNSSTGQAFEIIGSWNEGVGSSGGSNSITNSGLVFEVAGSLNSGDGSSGGFNSIKNSGTSLINAGSANLGINSNGGSNSITNTNTGSVGILFGSMNEGAGSSGGSNNITNSGVVGGDIFFGINNESEINTTTQVPFFSESGIIGSWNTGDNSSGGSNTITNSGIVGGGFTATTGNEDNISTTAGTSELPAGGIIGSVNMGEGSTGGSNNITNSGTVNGVLFANPASNEYSSTEEAPSSPVSMNGIIGSMNAGNNSSGGSNHITNSGIVNATLTLFATASNSDYSSVTISLPLLSGGIVGSWNIGDGSIGGKNSIVNSGTVTGDIYGSYNMGTNSTSTGNTINNSGTVDGSIYGSYNSGTNSSGGNDLITNSGHVSGSIYGEDGNDTIIVVGGSTLGGVADGGSGIDTLGFNNMGTVNSNVIGSTYLNFENLGFYGGTTTLTGDWDFSGGSTTVYAGNLLMNGHLSTDSFTVERNGCANLSGSVESGMTKVYGHMKVNGSLSTDDLTIASSGLLSGSGHIYGDVTNYGTISPGNSIGTLSINGSLSFMSGSVYAVELAPNGSSDMLIVNGPVHLHGGTVRTALPRSLYTNGQNWSIISAGGGISGAFGSVADNLNSSPTLDLLLKYNANQVLLEIERTPFASLGATPGEKGVGLGLDGVVPLASGSMAEFITSMDFDMNLLQIQNTLNALSPEMYTTFSIAGLQAMNVLDQARSRHQADLRQYKELGFDSNNTSTVVAEVKRNWNLWALGLGNWSEQDSEDNFLGHRQDLAGIITGADRMFSDWLRVGLDLGYSDSKLKWDWTGYNGDMQGVHLGAYASADLNGFFLDASSGYASFSNTATRDIRFDGFSARAGNDFDSSALQGRVGGGYDFKLNNWLLSPLASLGYTRLEQDDFTERGADFLNLHIEESATDSMTSTIGVRFSGRVKSDQWQFLPRAELSWLHQFEDDGASITANFINYEASSFTVTGLAPVDDQGLLSLGLTSEYGQNISLFLNCAFALADGYTSNQLSGGLNWKF